MTPHINIEGRKILVFSSHHPYLFESYELSDLLGYSQSSSLRKQTLNDWYREMVPDQDYHLIHDEVTLDIYRQRYFTVHGEHVKPMAADRGRLFFTPRGIVKVLNKTTKKTGSLLRDALEQEGYLKGLDLQDAAPEAKKSKEDRKFEYEVMRTLIEQLERLKDAQLRELAITAAETALGRELKNLRPLGRVMSFTVPQPWDSFPDEPKRDPSGPMFTEKGYYSLTRIGEKAGGYTARVAGLAADNVAKGLGYTREEIRTRQLPINELAMRPDTTTGKKRQMVRFRMDFANQVVAELRANPDFEPTLPPKTSGSLPSFYAGQTQYPKLSKGVFEDEEEDAKTPPSPQP